MPISDEDRYSRQVLFAPIGPKGQQRLRQSRAVVVGCGATGSVIASLLARAGVGTLRIVDRDYVEASNLQRQMLFDEQGNYFTTDNKQMVDKVEIYRDGKMYDVKVKLGD